MKYICEDCGKLATDVQSCACEAEEMSQEYLDMLEMVTG